MKAVGVGYTWVHFQNVVVPGNVPGVHGRTRLGVGLTALAWRQSSLRREFPLNCTE